MKIPSKLLKTFFERLSECLDNSGSPTRAPTSQSSPPFGVFIAVGSNNQLGCWIESADDHQCCLMMPLFDLSTQNASPINATESNGPSFERTAISNSISKSISGNFNQLDQTLTFTQRVRHSKLGDWLAIPLVDLFYVAQLLTQNTPPPATVVGDWELQLQQSKFERYPSPSTTLVTSSGLLIPLDPLLQAVLNDENATTPVHPVVQTKLLDWAKSHKPTLWPWESTAGARKSATKESALRVREAAKLAPTIEVESDEIDFAATEIPDYLASITSSPRTSKKQSAAKGSNRVYIIAGGIVAVVSIVGIATIMLNSSPPNEAIVANKSNESTESNRNGTNRFKVTPSDESEVSLAPEKEPFQNGSDSELVAMPLSGSEPQLLEMIEQPSLDRLLSSIQISRTKVDIGLKKTEDEDETVETISPDEIVMQSLQGSKNSANKLSSMKDQASDSPDESDSESSEADKSSTTKPASGDPAGPIEKIYRVQAAYDHDSLKFKQKVAPKLAALEVELELLGQKDDDIVISPKEKVQIVGRGLARWRVAFEDKDPELIVEVASQPSNRWQVAISVGCKFNAESEPVPIGPGDARMVGERLFTYHQWLEQSMTAVRMAPRRRRGGNVAGQLQVLQAQQRETEKTLKQWETIARLANELFANGQVTMKLSPNGSIEK